MALRIDDDPTTTTGILRRAKNKLDEYLLPAYNEDDLQANADAGGRVNDLATDVAAYYLARRRGNTPAAAFKEDYEEARADLEAFRLDEKQLPAVDLRHKSSPAFSNIRVVPGYEYRKIRVEWPISEDSPTDGYTQAYDWRSLMFFEY